MFQPEAKKQIKSLKNWFKPAERTELSAALSVDLTVTVIQRSV